MVSRNRDGTEGVLSIFRSQSDSREPLTSTDVADALDCSRPTADERLEELGDRGALESKRVGESERVWWVPDDDGDDEDRSPLFRSLVEATEEYAIFMLDPDGHVISWNRGAERIKGYDRPAILGEHFSTFYTDDDVAAGVPKENLSRALDQGVAEDEGWRVRADGSRFWANVTMTPIRDDDGELQGFSKVTRDMTERRERERELREERTLLERTLDATPSSVGVVTGDGEFLRSNERADEYLRTDADDGSDEGQLREVYDENGDRVPDEQRPYRRAFETGEPVRDWHCQVSVADGGRRWLSVNAVPLTDDDSVDRVVVCGSDVTRMTVQAERLEARRDELLSELDEVFERVSNAFIGLDDEWRFTYVNDRAADLLGREVSELIGADIWEALELAVGTRLEEQFREAMATQEATHFETYYEPLETWFEVDAYPSESGLSVYFKDVTDRRSRERELERYRRIVDNLPVGVYRNTPGPEGEFVEANAELAAIFDADSVDELMGHSVSDFYVDPDRRATFSDRLAEEGVVEDFEMPQETLDGRRIWISITAMRTEEDDDVYFDGVIQDVTERKQRERELERFETLFTESQDVNAVIDPDGTFSYLPPSTANVLGYDPAELTGENAFDYVHPDDRETMWEEFAAVVDDPDYGPRVELRFKHADGSWVVLEVQARNLLDDPSIEGIVAYSREATERKLFEDTLAALHESSRELTRSETKTAVSRTIVDAATSVLDLEGVITYRYDEDADLLTLDEQSADAGLLRETLPDFPADHSSLVGHAFCDGETKYYDDVREADHLMADPADVNMRAGQFVPMGDHGVLAVGWPDGNLPDDRTRRLIEILAANGEAAYDRVERERELAAAERRYRTLAENFPDGAVGVFDEDMEFTLVEGAIWDDVDGDPSDLEGVRVTDLVDDGSRDVAESLYAGALAGEAGNAEIEFGDDVFRVWALPMRDDDGDVYGGLSFAVDVTDRVERERQLEQAERRYRALAENFPDGAAGVYDEDLRYTLAEGSVLGEKLPGADRMEGTRMPDLFPQDTVADLEPLFRGAVEEGRTDSTTTEFDGRIWQVWATPLRDADDEIYAGLSFAIEITDRIERERELEEYETIVETIDDGVYVLDENFCFTRVNEAYAEMTGYDREELLGRHCSLVVGEEVTDASARRVEEIIESGGSGAKLEADIHRADGTTLRAESNFSALPGDDVENPRKVGIVRDLSERIERERQLEESRRRYRTIVDNFPNGAVAMVDEDLTYLTVGGDSIAEPDASAETLEGTHVEEHLSPELAEAFVPNYRTALGGEATTIEHQVEDTIYKIRFVPVRDDDGEVFAAVGMSQDITERVTRERELEARVRQQQVIADLGRRALGNPDLDDLFDDAVEAVAETLDNEYCKVLDLDADGEELLLRSGVGWNEGYVGEATVGIDRESQAGYTLLAEEPVVVEDMAAETRFTGPDLLIDHAVESGISVVIGSPEDPWGILGTHDTRRRDFSENDALFVQSVANILATAIDRRENELELEDQRERLAALNNVNGVVREINEALVDQSTREEIEEVVCRRLADSSSYRFAWAAGIDHRTESIDAHVEAGVDGYLDEVEMSIEADTPTGQGPTGRAARTGEMQVTNDVRTDPTYEPWRDVAERYGYRSSAAIPISYQDTLYGVLGLYTERVGAFTDEEREVVAQLGEVIGHAIAAIERKQALMSDEVVEVEFRMENVLEALDVPGSTQGRIEFDDAVPVDDDTFLQYGTATDGAIETVEAAVDEIPHWETVTVLSDASDAVRFELRFSEPPVVSAVASRGGYIDEAVIEDGDMHMAVHLPTTVDVRRVVDIIQDAYPMAEMATRRQVTTGDSRERIERTLTEDLTDRQRAALEASFHAGFFDWPRESSGEEVADSLGVSAPTFHQHLRKAQRKILETLLS